MKILSTKILTSSALARASYHGMHVDMVPFIRSQPILGYERSARVSQLLNHQHIIMTSEAAVLALYKLLDMPAIPFPSFAAWLMEGRTHQTFSSLFPSIPVVGTADTSITLAEKIIAAGVKQASYFCGNLRRHELPDLLLQAGITLSEEQVYTTSFTPVKISEPYDAVMFFSPSGVQSFFSVNRLPSHTACIALGPSTAAVLGSITANRMILAAKPTQEEMLDVAFHVISASFHSFSGD